MGGDAYDWLVVGAGFTGATLAQRVASVLRQRVKVIDRRPHIAGNAFDAPDEAGVLVHRYGPHIFHTNADRVWTYLSQFTRWRPYEHRVLAEIDGQLVPVPFNLTSLHRLFGAREAASLERTLLDAYGLGTKVPVLQLIQSPDSQVRAFGEYVYDRVFLGYTTKQWGRRPEELSPTVTSRVPVHISWDDRYFQDRYQAIPEQGYTRLFENLLDHPLIDVELGVDFADVRDAVGRVPVVYTGPIDEFFGYRHGPLPYRSLAFRHEHRAGSLTQATGQINYPNAHRYTRVTEHNHITGGDSGVSTVSYEYPCAHEVGVTEPYYPVPMDQTRVLFRSYAADAAALGDSVVFAGRLADYKYYNMDQAVARALQVFDSSAAVVAAA